MGKGFVYDYISGLHLELTTKCNAMCPMCNRNFKGKVRKNLPILELTLNDIKKILSPDFIKKLKLISICGVYGEPICNKDLKEILKYLYECNNNVDIDIYTNGGLYDENWWKDLALIVKDYNCTVIFGIDGIGDTHSLHRCNTKYERVIKNATAFINNAGKAQWDFIVFKHNENQVEDAKKLSKELGFKCFQVKKTSRFLKNIYEKDQKLDSTIADYGKHPVYDSNGNIKYYIELPENPLYRNSTENKMFELVKQYGNIDNYFDMNEIDCEALKTGGIFISAKGEVFPCCSVYQQVCYKTVHNVIDASELNEYNLYIKDNLSAFDKSIEEIVNGYFFKQLVKSFKCNSIKNGKPKCCSRTCGKNLDAHKNGHTTSIKYKEEK